jgi:prepilin-type processing-associated H-X9-DG protein
MGGLATEPTAFETRPEATAAAFPPAPAGPAAAAAYIPPSAAIFGTFPRDGGTGAAVPPPNVALDRSFEYTPPAPLLPRQFYSAAQWGSHTVAGDTNGWAVASIICAVIGLIVPVVPGVLAILFGTIAIRRLRETNSGAGMALGGIVVGVMGMIVSGGLFYNYVMPTMQWHLPSVAMFGNGGGSTAAKCTANLKKVGEAMRQYAAANDGHFPDKLESLVAGAKLPAELLICPASGDTVAPGATPAAQAASLRDGKHVSYVYAGHNLTNLSPAECVLMYETPDRHGDGMYVLFADGRVQSIGDIEANKAIARLSRGINPPWSVPAR